MKIRMDARTAINNFSFVLPFLVFYTIFIIFPVVQAAVMSGFSWDLLGGAPQWSSGRNYVDMLGGTGLTWDMSHRLIERLVLIVCALLLMFKGIRRDLSIGGWVLVALLVVCAALLGIHPGEGGSWNDPRFYNALENTVVFTLVSSPVIAGIGLFLAIMLHRRHRLTGLYRAIFFLPYILPVSVATLIWGYLFNPSRGLVSVLTEWVGVGTINWLSDPRFAMSAIIVTTVWWTVGFNMILFEAGLEDIDPVLYEAAALDGAGPWRQFRYITVPGLKHATLLVTVTQIIASFQIFGQVNIMTAGGPAGSTDVLVRYIYETAFRDTRLGYASSMSLVLFVLMVVISLVQFLMSKGKER
ncbi:carbohydrate ABC transporter permease [Schaalia vaccimaxillae]|uniref:carbohydrate ABC transporter permease n=1 Tax=Schaalia vaccimaxillae TaxID=183916 RepID=UPI0003FFF51E|nr:sugar ABC transporter permease [Schaalia vaccimaxillae]